MLKDEDWKTLSIARNKSEEFNLEMFQKLSPEEIPQNSSPVCYAKSDEVRKDYEI